MKQTRKGIVMRMLYIQRKFEQTPLTTTPWLLVYTSLFPQSYTILAFPKPPRGLLDKIVAKI
jgi:hypothetical protein